MLLATVALSACSKDKKEETTSTTTTTTTSTTADTKPAAAPAGDSIGVPSCDEYISKYEKCIGDNVPEAARAPLKEAFEQTRTSWKGLAANETTKSGLDSACKQALEMSKTALSMYKCQF